MKNRVLKLVLTAIGVSACAFAATGCTSLKNPPQNKHCVVRGDDVKSKEIKQILWSGSGATDVGYDTVLHCYWEDSSARYYNITTNDGEGDKPGPDQIKVPTADAVTIGVEGEFKFHTGFSHTREGEKLLRKFDEQYSARPYPKVGGNGTDEDATKVWKGTAGWGAFLNRELRPVIDEVVKSEVGLLSCAQIDARCAMLSNSGKIALADAEQGRDAIKAQRELENRIVERVNEELNEKFGGPVLVVTQFRIARTNLPSGVQNAVDASQQAYAELASTQAEIQRNTIEAKAALEKARIDAQRKQVENAIYEKSPALLKLEIAKAFAASGCTSGCYYGVEAVGIGSR